MVAMRRHATGAGLRYTGPEAPQGKDRQAVERAERADDAQTSDKERTQRNEGDIGHPDITGHPVGQVACAAVKHDWAQKQARQRGDQVDLHGYRGVQEGFKKHMGLARVLGYVRGRSVAAGAPTAKPAFAEEGMGFVNESNLHLALRETTGLLRQPGVWMGMAAVSLILALSGPFGTGELMRLAPRVGYWGLTVFVTFVSGAFVSDWTLGRGRAYRSGVVGATVLAGGATGLIVSAEVLVLIWLAIGLVPANGRYVAEIWANCTATALIIVSALTWHNRQAATGPVTARLLDRLEIDRRGALLSLSQQDHYVEVTTSAGQSLILMRLSDAIAKTEGTPGLQTHRSDWVAIGAVASAQSRDGRVVLKLHDGRELPLRRSYVAAVRRAGVLPAGKARDG